MNAKMLNKLLDQAKVDAARIKQLEKLSAQAIDDRDVAVAAAVVAVRCEALAWQHEQNDPCLSG